MKNNILTLALLIVCLNTFSQINPRNGYIITLNNDTIYGTLDFRTAKRNALICDFKANNQTVYNSYHPEDISAYRFVDDGKLYVAKLVKIDNIPTMKFLEFLIKGMVNLYCLDDTFEQRFYMEDEQQRFVEVYSTSIDDPNNESENINYLRKRHIGVLYNILPDSEKVKKKVPRLSMNKKNLIELTKDYHYEVCNTKTGCIEFETADNRKFIDLNYEASLGIAYNSFHDEELAL